MNERYTDTLLTCALHENLYYFINYKFCLYFVLDSTLGWIHIGQNNVDAELCIYPDPQHRGEGGGGRAEIYKWRVKVVVIWTSIPAFVPPPDYLTTIDGQR